MDVFPLFSKIPIDISFFLLYNDIVMENDKKSGGIFMKSTGVVRKVDELGRIVLPAEIRKILDINPKDAVEFFMDDDRIVIQKYQPSCIFCSSSEGLITYQRKNVCRECLRKMRNY